MLEYINQLFARCTEPCEQSAMIIGRVSIAGELEKFPGEQHEVPGDGQPMCGPATDGDRRALCQIRSSLGIEFDSTP